jgi:hypothetical protein
VEINEMAQITRKVNFAYDSYNGYFDSTCGLCGRRFELSVHWQLVAFFQSLNEDGYDKIDICIESAELIEPWILQKQVSEGNLISEE